MRDRAVETLRIILTVLGFALLIIFGSRAARQADDMKLAGATNRSLFASTNSLHAVWAIGAPVFADFESRYQVHSVSNGAVAAKSQTHIVSTSSPATTAVTPHAPPEKSKNEKKQSVTAQSDPVASPTTFTEPKLPKEFVPQMLPPYSL
jgi:hypothetical protein